MTNEEKLASPKRIFMFFREGGFYPLELPEATVADVADCNPGTLRVEDALTGDVVWVCKQIETMKCDWCGKEFPADARACVEAGFDAAYVEDDGEAWKGEDREPLPPGHIEAGDGDRKRLKAEMGLNDAELDELLSTGKIEGLGAIVCLECQDAGLEAAEAQ